MPRRTGPPQPYGPDERSWRVRLEVDDPNLQAALACAGQQGPGAAVGGCGSSTSRNALETLIGLLEKANGFQDAVD